MCQIECMRAKKRIVSTKKAKSLKLNFGVKLVLCAVILILGSLSISAIAFGRGPLASLFAATTGVYQITANIDDGSTAAQVPSVDVVLTCSGGLHLDNGRCTDPSGHADVAPTPVREPPAPVPKVPAPICNPVTDPKHCQPDQPAPAKEAPKTNNPPQKPPVIQPTTGTTCTDSAGRKVAVGNTVVGQVITTSSGTKADSIYECTASGSWKQKMCGSEACTNQKNGDLVTIKPTYQIIDDANKAIAAAGTPAEKAAIKPEFNCNKGGTVYATGQKTDANEVCDAGKTVTTDQYVQEKQATCPNDYVGPDFNCHPRTECTNADIPCSSDGFKQTCKVANNEKQISKTSEKCPTTTGSAQQQPVSVIAGTSFPTLNITECKDVAAGKNYRYSDGHCTILTPVTPVTPPTTTIGTASDKVDCEATPGKQYIDGNCITAAPGAFGQPATTTNTAAGIDFNNNPDPSKDANGKVKNGYGCANPGKSDSSCATGYCNGGFFGIAASCDNAPVNQSPATTVTTGTTTTTSGIDFNNNPDPSKDASGKTKDGYRCSNPGNDSQCVNGYCNSYVFGMVTSCGAPPAVTVSTPVAPQNNITQQSDPSKDASGKTKDGYRCQNPGQSDSGCVSGYCSGNFFVSSCTTPPTPPAPPVNPNAPFSQGTTCKSDDQCKTGYCGAGNLLSFGASVCRNLNEKPKPLVGVTNPSAPFSQGTTCKSDDQCKTGYCGAGNLLSFYATVCRDQSEK